MWSRFWQGGRNVSYQQIASATYTLPTSKIPLLDWTTLRVGYSATYGWTAASRLAVTLGNVLQNTQQKSATADFDFTRLYSKWRWMRALEPKLQKQPLLKNQQNNIPKNKADSARAKIKNPNDLPELNPLVKFAGHLITAVKRISVNYSENSASTIYGYMDSTRVLGMDPKTGQPGLGYIFGKQPGFNFVDQLARKGLMSRDTTLNNQNQQSYNQKLSIIAVLQPFRDFNIDVNFDKTFGKAYSELFKDTIGNGSFAHLNQYNTGTFSISFLSFKTLFENSRPDQVSSTFQKFETYRSEISKRLGSANPYSGIVGTDGYYKGYGQYSQDVLIPAFIAAYTGKSPKNVALLNEYNSGIKTNPFGGYIPKPNWRISYAGLSKLPGFDKIFTSFNVTHAYSSTLSMGSFTSSLFYQDPLGIRYPGFIDTTSGNFVPFFAVPNITITEQFSPLINIDMQFVNKVQMRIGFSNLGS